MITFGAAAIAYIVITLTAAALGVVLLTGLATQFVVSNRRVRLARNESVRSHYRGQLLTH